MATKPDLKIVPKADANFQSAFMNSEQVEATELMLLLNMPAATAQAFAIFTSKFPANATFLYQDTARSADPNIYVQVLKGSVIIGKITDGGNGFDEYLEIKSKKDDPNSTLDRIVSPLNIKKNIFTMRAGSNGAIVLMFRASNFRKSLEKLPTLLPESIKSQEKLFEKLMAKRAPKINYSLEGAALYQVGYMLAKSISKAIQDNDLKNSIWLFKRLKDMLHDYFVMNNPNREDNTSELEFYHEIIASIFTRK